MVPRSYLFPIPRYWPKRPFWLPTGLNLVILGSERVKNPKLLVWKRNGRIFGNRVWFQGRSQDIDQKGHFGCLLGSVWAFWDMNEIRTPNHFYGRGMNTFSGVEHGFRVVSLFVSKIMAKMTILAANWAKFWHFGILSNYIHGWWKPTVAYP